jgi:hypothetical protein
VKTAWPTLRRTIERRVRVVRHEILIRGVTQILDDSHMSRGGGQRDIPFGCPSQLFELTFVPAAPQRATPWCR